MLTPNKGCVQQLPAPLKLNVIFYKVVSISKVQPNMVPSLAILTRSKDKGLKYVSLLPSIHGDNDGPREDSPHFFELNEAT